MIFNLSGIALEFLRETLHNTTQKRPHNAEVAELVDAHDSGSCIRKDVEVRVFSSALAPRERDSLPVKGNEAARLLRHGKWVSPVVAPCG